MAVELRAFAEKVLFSNSLEDKLAAPDGPIIDLEPGTALIAPETPGRPDSLRFSTEKGNTGFARARLLQSDDDRGTLLHFFANHELLATELMALVLLKFPNAPAEFRMGVLETLREEQAHTQMYMRRMSACGMSFGDRPVNGYFWRSIASVESPLDYVTRLSLTFEQANLDYACHFAQLFRASGDTSTATILDKIYRDEITHVGYGLKWFRQWKEEGLTDWQAFQRQLTFPLSAHRAKGKAPFNAEGRRAAGLNDDFIRELQVSTASRGRTPRVFFFNPTAEDSVARNAANFTPTKDLEALSRDLDALSFYIAREDDLVLLRRRPSSEFLHQLQEAGLPIPEIETLDADGSIATDSPNRNRTIGSLRPWGWSPDSVALLAPFAANATSEGVATRWDPEISEFYSKDWSSRLLHELVASEPDLPLVPVEDCGRSAETLEGVIEIAGSLLQRHSTVVLKSAFGLSGRGMLRVESADLHNERTAGWIRNALQRHGILIVEPWHARAFDLSMQYEVTRRAAGTCEIIFKGGTRLINDDRGHFRACKVSHHFVDSMPREIARFTSECGRRLAWARELFTVTIPELLLSKLAPSSFEGPLGIDAFVYTDLSGSLRLQPVVEINPRFTMGRVAIELRRTLHPGSRGTFEIVRASDMPECSDIVTAIHGQHLKIKSGTLALTESDPGSSAMFGAIWRVEQARA